MFFSSTIKHHCLVLLIVSSNQLLQTLALGEDEENWPSRTPYWNGPFTSTDLFYNNSITAIPDLTLALLSEKTSAFPIKFPIETVKSLILSQNITSDKLEQNINSAYPLIHEAALSLIVNYLDHHRRFGFRKHLKHITLIEFIDRLLTKRAISFIGPEDEYLLRDGTKSTGKWESIGTSNETSPLLEMDYLSYEELKFSALLGVSSHSLFTNNGQVSDKLENVAQETDKFEADGVLVGLVGARLEKPLVMEYNEVVKSRKQNNYLHGYGNGIIATVQGIVMNNYLDVSNTYDELELFGTLTNETRFIKLDEDTYFDKLLYKRRITLNVDLFLIEANQRAKEAGKNAFAHIELEKCNGQLVDAQTQIFLDTLGKRILFLGKVLNHISNLSISVKNHSKILDYKDGDKLTMEGHPAGGITISFNQRNRFDKLTGDDKGKLLVVLYDWNSNALPGNSFWVGDLTNNCCGAAVASNSQIAEVQNPLINPKVQGGNLHVATLKGLMSIKDYIEAQKVK